MWVIITGWGGFDFIDSGLTRLHEHCKYTFVVRFIQGAKEAGYGRCVYTTLHAPS